MTLARADVEVDEPRRFELGERVDLVLARCRTHAEDAGITLSLATEGDNALVWTQGSPDAVDCAVRNVVNNALRFTPRGGRVRAEMSLHAGVAELWVDDSGPGVFADEREVIFSRLRRGTHPPADQSVGHGLGLAIVRRVMERQGGDCTVEDSPLGGARFSVNAIAPVWSTGACWCLHTVRDPFRQHVVQQATDLQQ